ncbi:MAG: hypothetical protein AABP62_06665 [Planctomycetota bacterium]
MPTSPQNPSIVARAASGWLLAGASLLCGCEQQEKVASYTVPRHESLQSPKFLVATAKRKSQPARMLAAIVPHGAELWFFKLQGPPDDVAARDGEFHEFLKSVRFANDTKIEWTLPATWKETPGNANRYATLVLSAQPPLEVTVTVLAAGGDDRTQQLLDNINRWRGQLDLPHIEADDLPTRTETIEAGELTITAINIVGKAAPKSAMGGMMMPPEMGRPDPREATSAAERPADGAKGSSESPFDKPPEWTEVPPKQFQLARFTVGEGEQTAEIAITRAGGSREANINRWRGQLGLNPLSPEELKQAGQPFEVGSKTGELIEIVVEDQALLGVMIPDGDQSLFIKLTGHAALAVKERSRFEAFAKSLKLE